MSEPYCILCASDEGVFLDITANNKHVFEEQFEICSLAKVFTAEQLPTKICHKCAYELVQCTSFLQKLKQAIKRKLYVRKRSCHICLEPTQNKFIFDLTKDKTLQYSLCNKLKKLFNNESEEFCEHYKVICLSCRYVLDILLDLKNVSKEISLKLNDIANDKIDYATFPKIKTTVVSRKTTITESARTTLNILQESDNNLVVMTRTRSQNSKLHNNKLGICSKCQNSITNDDDKYKIHKTGDNVCKSCLKNTNVSTSDVEKQVQQNISETKLCKVYLKDVLKDTDVKEQKLYKINKDDVGNKKYAVKEKNLTNENKSDRVINTRRQALKRSVKSMKVEYADSNNEDLEPNKKHKSGVSEESETESKKVASKIQGVKQLRGRNKTPNVNQNSDSDSSVLKTIRKSVRTLTKHKLATGSSWSDADIDHKQDPKKLKTILKGVPTTKSIQVSDVSSSNEEVPARKTRLKFTTASPTMIDDVKNKAAESTVTRVSLRKTKNSFKQCSTSLTNKTEDTQTESDDKEVIFETEAYVCDECGASYENKLLGLTHKLSHYKQPTLKLQKLSEENLIMEKESGTSEPTDNLSEDPSESIALVVEDDEEELAEPVKNLNENNFTDISSNEENKACSPTKEIVEDAVDMKLVMKESDDDQLHKTQTDEEKPKDVETNIANSSTQNEDETTMDKDGEKENEKENVNLEENHDTVQSQTEHVEKEHEAEKHEEENEQEKDKSKSDEEEVQDISLDIDGENEEKDTEKESEETENVAKTMEEGNNSTKEEEDNKTEKEENNKTEKEENDSTEKEEESERLRNEEDDIAKEEENDTTKAETNSNEDIEEVKEKEDIENEESQNIQTIEDTEEDDVICESSINFVKNSVDSTVNVDTVDSPKEVELDSPELIEVENEADKTIDVDDLKEIIEQKSPKSAEKVKSPSRDSVQTKINCSPKQSKVVEEIELVEQDDTIEKDETDNSKAEKLPIDSDNAAVEILQVESEVDRTIDSSDLKEPIEQKSPRSVEKVKSPSKDSVQTKVNSSPKQSKVVEEIGLVESNDIDKNETDNSKGEKLTTDSANAVAEVLQEVLDLANAEVLKRQEVIDINAENDSIELETVENISREINNTTDMPSLKTSNDDSKNVISLE